VAVRLPDLTRVDLTVVALLSAKNMYSANVSTAKVADEILKTAIDLIA
jgi:flagellar basal body rod protein FlgC